MSRMIWAIYDDCGADEAILLPFVRAAILGIIIKYLHACLRFLDHGDPWCLRRIFANLDQETLNELYVAATYLEIPRLCVFLEDSNLDASTVSSQGLAAYAWHLDT
jgi:hypothetical protein